MRRLAARAALFSAALGLTLALGEAGTRAVFRDVTSSADGRSFFARKGAGSPPNRFGYRERDFVGEVPPQRYRLVLIGDSITYGQGLARHERYGDLLQQYLGLERYEVLNFGLVGADLRDHDAVLAHKVLPLEPDFVLLQLYINDFEPPDGVRPATIPLVPLRALDGWLFRSSALYTVAAIEWQALQDRFIASRSYAAYMARLLQDANSPASRASTTILHQILERGRRAGVPVGIVLFPSLSFDLGDGYPFGYLHDRVARTCADYDLRCVDLLGPFARYRPASRLWVNRFDPHPNAHANQIAAVVLLGGFYSVWGAGRPERRPPEFVERR